MAEVSSLRSYVLKMRGLVRELGETLGINEEPLPEVKEPTGSLVSAVILSQSDLDWEAKYLARCINEVVMLREQIEGPSRPKTECG